MGKMMEWQVCIVYLKKKKTAAKRVGKIHKNSPSIDLLDEAARTL